MWKKVSTLNNSTLSIRTKYCGCLVVTTDRKEKAVSMVHFENPYSEYGFGLTLCWIEIPGNDLKRFIQLLTYLIPQMESKISLINARQQWSDFQENIMVNNQNHIQTSTTFTDKGRKRGTGNEVNIILSTLDIPNHSVSQGVKRELMRTMCQDTWR